MSGPPRLRSASRGRRASDCSNVSHSVLLTAWLRQSDPRDRVHPRFYRFRVAGRFRFAAFRFAFRRIHTSASSIGCRFFLMASSSPARIVAAMRISDAVGVFRYRRKNRGASPRFPFRVSRFLRYFRSSCWPVHEPRVRRILPRSTAPLLDVATDPSTWFAIASPLAVAPSNAAQFLK